MTQELARALEVIMRPGFGEVAEPPPKFDGPWSKELVQAIAMDIGKDTVAYIEVMYPKAIASTSSTFKLSIRNHIYNQIMAAIEVTDEGQIKARLQDRKKFRRWWTAAYRKIRKRAAVPPTD
jgi:hypothetical protein